MTVLIAKMNQKMVLDYYPDTVFEESTKNTSTFKISAKKFDELCGNLKIAGYNIYALFTW